MIIIVPLCDCLFEFRKGVQRYSYILFRDALLIPLNLNRSLPDATVVAPLNLCGVTLIELFPFRPFMRPSILTNGWISDGEF